MQNMNDVQSVIEWIVSKGFQAKRRYWSSGESVVAYVDTKITGNGIEVIEGMYYIFKENGEWVISDFNPENTLANNSKYRARSISELLPELENLLIESRGRLGYA